MSNILKSLKKQKEEEEGQGEPSVFLVTGLVGELNIPRGRRERICSIREGRETLIDALGKIDVEYLVEAKFIEVDGQALTKKEIADVYRKGAEIYGKGKILNDYLAELDKTMKQERADALLTESKRKKEEGLEIKAAAEEKKEDGTKAAKKASAKKRKAKRKGKK